LMPQHDVPRPKRSREHREVLSRPLDRSHHGPRRLTRSHGHRRRREQPRRDEVDVRNTEGCAGGLVHERAEPDPRSGHDASPEATVIAVAASSPGATKSMYGTPRDAPEDLFTSVPSPIPRAPR